jgi:hypothetical protein
VKHFYRLHLLLSLCAVVPGTHAMGQEYSYPPLQQTPLTDCDPTRPSTSAREDDYEYGPSNNVAACSNSFCGYACRSEGFIFSAEVCFVDVRMGDGDDLAARWLEFTTPAAPAIPNLDPNPDPAARLSFGWQTCDGLGVQAHFWEFENAVSTTVMQAAQTDPILLTHAWDVMVFDVEVMLNTMINEVWDTSLSGGYRFAEYEEGASVRVDNNTSSSRVTTRYLGNGLTAAGGLRRQLTNRFSVMANGRVSLLFGDASIDSGGRSLPLNALNAGFDARYTLESQVGASYEHPICGGGFWFARGGYEVQYWNDFVAAIGSQTDSSSIVFDGLFVAIGLQR